MLSLAILGSTGSIGTQALAVIRHFPDRFRVLALAAGGNLDLLAQQVHEFRPELVSVGSAAAAQALAAILGSAAPAIHWGPAGLRDVATHPGVTAVLTSVVGILGLEPTLAALRSGKRILLANKETLVAAGVLVMAEAAAQRGVAIIPVDSEHNALFQCLEGQRREHVRRLVLTASGGPFHGRTRRDLSRVTPAEALRHPRWRMGPKVTVDSATLFNKGLEVIEAHHLFGVPVDQVAVLIHPESVIHSMVELVDGSVLAQLGVTDMRLPIQHALCYPERCAGPLPPLDLLAVRRLTFAAPDEETFPSLKYARQAVTMGGVLPAILNAANEVAVERFLSGQIGFGDIFRIVDSALGGYAERAAPDLPAILAADAWARRFAASFS